MQFAIAFEGSVQTGGGGGPTVRAVTWEALAIAERQPDGQTAHHAVLSDVPTTNGYLNISFDYLINVLENV